MSSSLRYIAVDGRVLDKTGHIFLKSFSRILSTFVEDQKKPQWRPKLVVFDKNGTLINFETPWVPWAQDFAIRVEKATGIPLKDDLLKHLDVCIFTKRVKSGVLASGTSFQIKAHVRSFLQLQGINEQKAIEVVAKSWRDCDPTVGQHAVKEFTDLRLLFQSLTSHGIKLSVCTSDDRRVTEKTMGTLGLIPFISLLVCGDDGHTIPKPHVSNIEHICQTLSVAASDTAVVGDTQEDMMMGVNAGVGMNIGVLSGIGTRLELTRYADVITHNVQDALPQILNPQFIDTYRVIENRLKKASSKKAQAVIFDKDGTLVCFHSMWTPWAKYLIERLEKETSLDLSETLMKELGYCTKRSKWIPGLFTEGTAAQGKDKILGILKDKGLQEEKAKFVLNEAWQLADKEVSQGKENKNLVVFDNPTALFKVLKQNDIKVAICTADSREGTIEFLEGIGATNYVDLVVCGDDPTSVPKPAPHNALNICEQLGVDPARVVVVGDTLADLGMGRSAKLGATVAVLSGVGDVEHLQDHADHVILSIRDILPIVLPQKK